MGNNGLDILNAAKKQKAKSTAKPNNNVSTTIKPQSIATQSIDDMAAQYFNDSDDSSAYSFVDPNATPSVPYDAHEEMKSIQQGISYANSTSKLPSAILESIMKNPLDMPADTSVEDKVINNGTRERTLEIIESLDAMDGKSKRYVNTQKKSESEEFDYNTNVQSRKPDCFNEEKLASMIENIIDAKFKQYMSDNTNATTLKFMRLGDKFTFMDDANNVYDCKLIYKGKGQVKSKK